MIRNEVLNRLRSNVDEKVTTYVLAYNGHQTKKKVLNELKKAAANAVDAYNDELAKATYKEWDVMGDAVKTALRERVVRQCLSVTYKVDEDSDVMAASFNSVAIKVKLTVLAETIGKDKFASADWFTKVQRLAWIIAGALNRKLGENPHFCYEVDEATKQFRFPDDIDPHTEEGCITALQQVFDSILFIPDKDGKNVIGANEKAWTCIRESLTKQGSAIGSVAISGTGKMTELVADAMHTVITNGDFTLVNADK